MPDASTIMSWFVVPLHIPSPTQDSTDSFPQSRFWNSSADGLLYVPGNIRQQWEDIEQLRLLTFWSIARGFFFRSPPEVVPDDYHSALPALWHACHSRTCGSKLMMLRSFGWHFGTTWIFRARAQKIAIPRKTESSCKETVKEEGGCYPCGPFPAHQGE